MLNFQCHADLNIAYQIWRDHNQPSNPTQPWITLINGFTRSSKDFKSLATKLVSAGFQVLALDNRGSGETIWTGGEFTLEDLAADVLALWQHLKIRTSHIFGISMGGQVCQILATHYPQQVSKVCLVSTSYGVSGRRPPEVIENYLWPKDYEGIRSQLAEFFSIENEHKFKLLIDSMAKEMFKGTHLPNSLILNAHQQQAQALVTYFKKSPRPQFNHQTLVIHGRGDRKVNYQHAWDLTQHLPQAEFTLLAGVGHLLLVESSQSLFTLTHLFLQK